MMIDHQTIASITKLSPVAGDVVVVRINTGNTPEIHAGAAQELKSYFEEWLPEVKCVVVPAHMELSVLTRQQMIDALAVEPTS